MEWVVDYASFGGILESDCRLGCAIVVDVETRRQIPFISELSRNDAVASVLRTALGEWGRPRLIRIDSPVEIAAVLGEGLAGVRIEHTTPRHLHRRALVEQALHRVRNSLPAGTMR